MTDDAAAEPAARADARRNYDNLLAAARAAFAEHGIDASLRDVARRAGVGIGTLYRHFPTRDALLESLLRNGIDHLRRRADDLATAPSPGDALLEWLRDFASGASSYPGVSSSLLGALFDKTSVLHAPCAAMNTAAARLVDRAKRAGAVRQDVTITELLALTAAISWAAERMPDDSDEVANRFLSLVTFGIQPRV